MKIHISNSYVGSPLLCFAFSNTQDVYIIIILQNQLQVDNLKEYMNNLFNGTVEDKERGSVESLHWYLDVICSQAIKTINDRSEFVPVRKLVVAQQSYDGLLLVGVQQIRILLSH